VIKYILRRFKLKILVVDDSKVARKYILRSIASIGIEAEFREAENGQEALSAYKEERADVVFLDLTMPIMDGYEALREIIAYDKDAQVIVVSADVQSEAKLRVLKDGAKNMYPKPISDEKMRTIFAEDIV